MIPSLLLRSVLFGALALGFGASAAQSETRILRPASQWNVDFAEGQCVLARLFGPKEEPHAIYFRQQAPGTSFGLSASGPSFKRFRSRKSTKMQIATDGPSRRDEPFVGNSPSYGKALIYTAIRLPKAGEKQEKTNENGNQDEFTSLPQLDLEAAGAVQFVEFKQGSRSVRLETGPLADAFKVLNQCTQDLVRDWGLDPERHLTATRMPRIKNFRATVNKIVAKYPRDALNRGEQAILNFRVMIDETGKATDCIIRDVTQTERLDSPACRPLMQATYEPALDANGAPFPSYYSTRITYLLGR